MKRSQVERKFPSFEVSATAQRLRRICDTLFHIPHILHSPNITSLKIRLRLLRQNFVDFVFIGPKSINCLALSVSYLAILAILAKLRLLGRKK